MNETNMRPMVTYMVWDYLRSSSNKDKLRKFVIDMVSKDVEKELVSQYPDKDIKALLKDEDMWNKIIAGMISSVGAS